MDALGRGVFVTQVWLIAAQRYNLKMFSNRREGEGGLVFDHRVVRCDSGPHLLDDFVDFVLKYLSP